MISLLIQAQLQDKKTAKFIAKFMKENAGMAAGVASGGNNGPPPPPPGGNRRPPPPPPSKGSRGIIYDMCYVKPYLSLLNS